MAHLEGYVSHIRFHNEENGYTVLDLECTHGDEVLVGYFHFIGEGEYLVAEGDLVDHAVHGPQYQVKSYELRQPEDKAAMERYLGSGAIKGIGKALAKRIIKKFKGNTFDIMEKEPERLAEVKGISLKKAMDIAIQFQEKQEMRHAMMFLADYGIATNYAVRIFEEYGDDMYEILRANPYKLAEDIHGIGFKLADGIAMRAGIAPDSGFRICASILYVLQQAVAAGHVCLPREILCRNAGNLLDLESDFVSDHLMEMVLDKRLMIRISGEEEYAYLPSFYFMERNTAVMLGNMDLSFPMSEEEWESRLTWLESCQEIEPDQSQLQAIRQALTQGISVITGGPGTGKTTTINQIIRLFEQDNADILLAAPTGRAAKRMTEATGYEAKTIHRLLEISGGAMDGTPYHFDRNEENPLEADVIIIDEMSMVDLQLMYSLLKAVLPGTRLILVGDANQLPSVGAGNVLRDIISSGRFPVVSLTRIYRQDEDSQIIVNAHKINRGEQISLDNRNKDFFFFYKEDARSVIGALVFLIRTRLPEYIGADPMDIQVLTPMRRGELGVEHLNRVLQYYLNPASPEKEEHESGSQVFREGDKVMQIRNNYKLEWQVKNGKGFVISEGTGVFNGDLGIIKEINTFSEKVVVEYDEGRRAEYSYSMLDEIELAYAVTIHKSQGSEYPAVIIPLLRGPDILYNRNLLYIAVTRSQKCAVIVGRDDVVEQMIRNEREQRRYSGLRESLEEFFIPD